MIHPLLRKLAGALFVALLVLAAAGCGRRGPLDPPPPGAPDSLTSTAPGQPTGAQPAVEATNPPPPSPDAAKNELPGATQPQANHAATVKPVLNSFPLDPVLN